VNTLGASAGAATKAAGAERRTFRAKRGDVKLAILSTLAKGSANGYELRKKIAAASGGEWRISSGSIYPQLEALIDHNLVGQIYTDSIYSNSEYTYSLTSDGRKHYADNRDRIEKVWESFKPTSFEGSELEVELQKLQQAVDVLTANSPEAVGSVIDGVVELRKRIYSLLSI